MTLTPEEIADARLKYSFQKSGCRPQRRTDINGNPIEMRLTFEEWLKIWIDSGKYHLRGSKRGCYCMARKGDIGHYELGNIEIILHSENVSFSHTGEKHPMFGIPHPNIGRVGEETGKAFKGVIIATHILTGTQLFLEGKGAIQKAGFDPSTVYKCVKGKIKTHANHTFKRIPITSL